VVFESVCGDGGGERGRGEKCSRSHAPHNVPRHIQRLRRGYNPQGRRPGSVASGYHHHHHPHQACIRRLKEKKKNEKGATCAQPSSAPLPAPGGSPTNEW
jgi:hypothetical protein